MRIPAAFRFSTVTDSALDLLARFFSRSRTRVVEEAILEKHAEMVNRVGDLTSPANVARIVFEIKRADGKKRSELLVQLDESLSADTSEETMGRALVEAAREQSAPDLLGFLLDRGAPINWANASGHTPLSIAVTDQPGAQDTNLQAITFLLERGGDPFMVPHGWNYQDLYDAAESRGLKSTTDTIRQAVRRIPLQVFLARRAFIYPLDRLMAIARFRIVQGWHIREIRAELDLLAAEPEMAEQLSRSFQGNVEHIPAWILSQNGCWRRFVVDGLAAGVRPQDLAAELKSCGCNWPDAALALSRGGLRPVPVLDILFPLIATECGGNLNDYGIGSLAIVVTAAVYHYDGLLEDLRIFLARQGFDIRELINRSWLTEDRKADFLART